MFQHTWDGGDGHEEERAPGDKEGEVNARTRG